MSTADASVSPGSPYYASLLRNLEASGMTPAGRDWLIKAMHPPAPVEPTGVPDEVYVPSVRTEYRNQHVVSKPASLAAGPWDLLLWRRPGDVVPCVCVAAVAGFDFSSPVAAGGNAVVSVVQMQPVTTYGPVQVRVLDTGFPLFAGAYFGTPDSRPMAWRTTYSSMTTYLTASSLNNQGTVYATQTAPRPVAGGQFVQLDPLYGAPVVHNRVLFDLPLSENLMQLSDPRAYTGEAKHGTYQPIRAAGPGRPYTRIKVQGDQSGYLTVTDPATAIASPGWFGSAVANAPIMEHGIPVCVRGSSFGEIQSPGWTDANGPFDSGYDSMCNALVIYRGLDAAASVTVKLYTGYEYVPAADSPSVQFVRAPAAPDYRAMEAYFRLCHEMPQCYPGSYNSLGSILGAIAGVAQRAWPVIKRVVPAAISAGYKAYSAPAPAAAPAAAPPRIEGPSKAAKRRDRKVRVTTRDRASSRGSRASTRRGRTPSRRR